ncbi:MAG: sigma-70 family RNA polymerase sigma factor, partial [Desulfatiglandales bacterium]
DKESPLDVLKEESEALEDQIYMDQIYWPLVEALRSLDEKEKLVLSLYYVEELTMKEIAQVLNLTESRISQIHARAIRRLRSRLRKKKLI